ncbi:MAG: hypothetical protein A4E35_02338 [Methanoregula sp. PtaU1.Bin051]|nr:MAG: hypothetical protein A4E35_02338 [Methanoregula sp. PtaU1.Bin051]
MSEVVGEMLMIGLAILLITVFSSVVGNFIPSSHDPSLTIIMTNDKMGTITFWHKGGDWVKVSDLRIIVRNATASVSFSDGDSEHPLVLVPDKGVFDLGSNITIRAPWISEDETISLVTDRARLFSAGVVP